MCGARLIVSELSGHDVLNITSNLGAGHKFIKTAAIELWFLAMVCILYSPRRKGGLSPAEIRWHLSERKPSQLRSNKEMELRTIHWNVWLG